MIDLTPFVNAIIALAAAAVTAFLIPYLREKLGEIKYNQMITVIGVAVAAAEQLYKPYEKKGEEKLIFVKDYLQKKGYDVDTASVKIAIEAAVNNL